MQNLRELKDAFLAKAATSRLEVECPMDGTFFSDKVIIVEAPGEREVAQKLPLVGGSGGLLWKTMLKHNKLTRKDFYITNVSKRQVSFTDGNKKAINKNELSLWNELLVWELGWLPNVRYIVVLGNMAFNALTGHSGITSWRGSVLLATIPDHRNGGTRTVQVVCCNNPAAVIREPKLEVTFNMDIARLDKVMTGKHKPFEVSTILYPTYAQVEKFIDEGIKAKMPIGHDIETIGGETACIGFADSSTTAICIAFRTRTENVYDVKEELAIRRKIQSFYHSGTQFVAQNGMFDITWQWFKDRLHLPKLWFDTMLAHHTLYPPLPHNLGFITTQYTDNPYYKDEKDTWREGGDIEQFWQYNGKDCGHLMVIYQKQLAELKEQGLDKFFFDHVMRLQPHLARMTVGGLKMDLEMKAQLDSTLQQTVGELMQKFQKLCIEAVGEEIYFNPASPKQMSDLYFNRLKLVGRGTSTDAENRDRMFRHPRTNELARQIIATHNDLAKEQKFYGTYVKAEADSDGRFRCTYNQTGTQSAPGRLSSSQTLWGSGGNLQNQPDRAHPMYVADEGYGFGYFDLSQAEARYVGWAANIETWIEQFERARLDGKYDAHRALASDLFNVPYDEVPTADRYDSTKGYAPPEGKVDGDVTIRYVAKRCRHGLNYRMAPDRLATTAGLPLKDAETAYRLYHRLTPELRQWWNDLEIELKQNGSLFNSFGRRFILMERPSPEAQESIVAFKPQSTIGDKVCRVMYQSESDPRWPVNCRMALNIHDALIAMGPLDKIPTALSIMKAYAEEPIMVQSKAGTRPMIIPADTKISYPDEKGVHRWSQLKPIQVDAIKLTA